jgi:peroxiredoxin
LAFQLDLPKFEAENTQVLGVSVDFNDTNRAWADKLGLTYPLLSDAQRKMATAYETLNENAALIKTPGVAAYLRSKRAWFVIDKLGVIRYMKIESPSLIPGDELLDVVKKFH